MKAITYRRYGSPDVLRVEELAKPVVNPNQYEIRVHAAEVTKADCELRSFRFPVKWFWLPLRLVLGVFKPRNPILGGYFSGTISQTSSADSRFQIGDEVLGHTGIGFGAYGQYIKVSAKNTMVKKPSSMSFVEAAAMPLGGLNAIHFLNIANVAPGQRILIIGAGGSIGLFAVQIALAKGAIVTAVDKGAKRAMLMQLGVSHFIDYQLTDVYSLPEQFDVVFSMVAQAPFFQNLKKVKTGGTYVTGNPSLTDMLLSAAVPLLIRKKALFRFAKESVAELNELVSMYQAGKLKVVLDSILPMENAKQAHEKVEQELRNGAVVLDITSTATDP